MKSEQANWTKSELQTYILLLCANADSIETEEEIGLIKTKTNKEIFDKMYQEFSADTEEESLEKIQDNLVELEYSHKELTELRREMFEVFFSDKKFSMMENTLDKILDNILY
ncbi:hypothetical protein [Christiangramia forsetii]|uniref:Co-chaperone DjlA N-terminal domain-containing protein n=2 Tax=Christiangramia forsetii TaxID=411153 RepID=A0LXZ3_CHRFK|nr:hypothetical protein [Christiangramia forsetii]GGG35425.1 hypothetical protein GCM10011532_19020 [Christiangramia forsetii]CAL65238.1 hypothetical protein GFO_0250 [Christiangramia forsetii KT0803]